MSDNKDTKQKLESQGGMWNKTSKAGNDYLFGKLTVDGKIVLFRAMPNTYKKAGENTPDYKIFINTDEQIKTKPVKVSKPVVKEVADTEEENEEGKF